MDIGKELSKNKDSANAIENNETRRIIFKLIQLHI